MKKVIFHRQHHYSKGHNIDISSLIFYSSEKTKVKAQGNNFKQITLLKCHPKPCFGSFVYRSQRVNKLVSDSPGLVDFAIGLVNSVFNLPDGQVMFFEEFE